MITIQYLEPNPETTAVSPAQAGAKLQGAFDLLPITAVLVGWALPEPLVTAVREITHANHAALYRWQPLLTGDGTFMPRPEWQTVGVRGERVPGFRDLPEFTFVCPHKTAVRAAILSHLQTISRTGLYDGIFLDRMRFPSPADDPGRWLACFCPACEHTAAQEGLDLTAVRHHIHKTLDTPQGARLILQDLLDHHSPAVSVLSEFLDFRTRAITHFIAEVTALIRTEGLAVGLDCFAPSLTRLVGQNLTALAPLGDWLKVMTYIHTLGPAGLPYELLALAQWLMAHQASEEQSLSWLSELLSQPLPATLKRLRNPGLSATVLQAEITLGKTAVSTPMLAGIELVALQGVTHLSPTQIKRDMGKLRQTHVDGLSLSWDLWQMPMPFIELVRSHWKDVA